MERLKEIDKQIETLNQERYTLIQNDRKSFAADFIRVNGVTLDDIELSDGDDNEMFWTVWQFADWLKDNSTKRFAEWNGQIYWQSDLKEGRWVHTEVYIDDLKA